MKKNNKKFYVIIILIFILLTIGFSNKSYGYFFGYNDLWSRTDLYCIEHGGPLHERVNYNVNRHIKVEGNNCVYDSKNQWNGNYYENGVMAYIIAQQQGYSYGRNPHEAVGYGYSSAQWAIWSIIDTYLGNSYIDNQKFSSGLLKSAYEWAVSLGTTQEHNVNGVKNNTNRNSLKTELYQYGGNKNQCIRFGPFKLSFSGHIRDLKVKDQDGREISKTNNKGNQQMWFYIFENGRYSEIDPEVSLKNEQEFYVDVSKDANIKKISGFSYSSEQIEQNISENSYKTEEYQWKYFEEKGFKYGPYTYNDSERLKDIWVIDSNNNDIKGYTYDSNGNKESNFFIIPYEYVFDTVDEFVKLNPRTPVRGDGNMQLYVQLYEEGGPKGINAIKYKTQSKYSPKEKYDKMDINEKIDNRPYASKQMYYWNNDGITYYRVGPFNQKFSR